MIRHFQKPLTFLLALTLAWSLCGMAMANHETIEVNAADYPVTQDGSYTSMEEVAVYLHTFGELPSNFLTKKQAAARGWQNQEGNLGEAAPGCSIGGDHFGNYEGNVKAPDGKTHQWTECDIDSDGGYRNGKRIVFSNDGLIFYSGDHYSTFTQIIVVEGSGAQPASSSRDATAVKKDGQYTSMEEVAAYLNAYGRLPGNYLTKSQAKKLGWTGQKDNLGSVAPGCAIGGDAFGNREGLLPAKDGRTWKECDVNTQDGKRGKERIVYSSDGLIFYSPDNHNSFRQLY